jgi:hypothetical protein
MGERVRVHISFDTALSPEGVVVALTDFSTRRTAIWPNLDPSRFQIHELGEDWAEVTEGFVEPAVWARERYDWRPDHVSIKALESNFCVPGDGTEIAVTAIAGGSHIELDWEREAATPEWEPLMAAMGKDGEALLLAGYRDRFDELAAEVSVS